MAATAAGINDRYFKKHCRWAFETKKRWFPVCVPYLLKCPEPAQWSIRARSHCLDPSKYFCLMNDLINGYSENCTIFDFLPPGRKNVLRGGLDADICSSDRYQPWPLKFFTNVSTNCIFLKSACNEEGQVVYDKGNRNTDATCRCDNTRGYEFFVKPQNPCFCVPSEEDCSCYLKMCITSPDYGCIHLKKNESINQCNPISEERNNNEGNQSYAKYIIRGKQFSSIEEYRTEVAIFVTSILPVIICVSFLFAVVLITIRTITSRCLKEYEKYNIPIEIQNMKKEEKARYIQILKNGSTKRYYIKIIILGRQGVGKTSLMKRLLHKRLHEVKSVRPTDGIDIETKCKVDIKSGRWVFSKGDTPDERIGRVLRKQPDELNHDITHEQKSRTVNEKTDDILRQTKESDSNDKSPIQLKEDIRCEAQSMKYSVNNQNTYEDNDRMQSSTIYDKDKNMMKYISHSGGLAQSEGMIIESKNTVPINNETIETVLEKGRKAKVSNKEYADCIIMDFAGHSEYYSTHQTFLTKHAIYLVVFSLKDNNPFTEEEVDESEKLSFWIDNIHCYASQQSRQDVKKGGISPPIIMICTGEDNEKDQKILEHKKGKWEKSFTKFMGNNQRCFHIRGGINYISNMSQSENAFHTLRRSIFEIAKEAEDMSMWGFDYPVRWINFEKNLITQRNENKNVLEFKVIREKAKKCPLSITSEEELILFLKFQHDIGNLIFYDVEGLKEYVIMNPSWLIDAFKCIICANDFRPFSTKHHSEALQKFAETGEISTDVCKQLFREKSEEHANHSALVLGVMERFDIIVKLNDKSFICPSGIKLEKDENKSYNFEGKCEGIDKNTDSFSSWLCIEFEFLPPALYHHLLVLCIRDPSLENPKLYLNIGIFRIKENNGRDKFILCRSKNTIKVQIVQLASHKYEKKTNGQVLFNNISSKINDIKTQFDIHLDYKLIIKCGDEIDLPVKQQFFRERITSAQFCDHHKVDHDLEDLFRFWFERDKPEFITKAVIEKSINQKYVKENISIKKAFAHDQASVIYNLPVSVTLRQQFNIKKSENENLCIYSCLKIGNRLMFTDYSQYRLIICNADGTDIHHISLLHGPFFITEIDSNTVAVSCRNNKSIQMINISTRSVTSIINTSGYCYGISYDDHNLYVVYDRSIIHVMDLTGKVTRTITLPSDRIHDLTVNRDRLICVENKSIYCCSLDGKVMWKFKHDLYQDRMTTDDVGNVYMTDRNTNTLVVVTHDGKLCRKILTKSDGLDQPCGFNFDKNKTTLLVCNIYDGKAFLFDVKMKSKSLAMN